MNKLSIKKLISLLLVVFLMINTFGCSKPQPQQEEYDKGNWFNYGNQSSSYYSGWNNSTNVGNLDSSVIKAARAKRTNIIGNNKDIVTILVYMCGADLESKGGMASYDLQEMAKANLGKNVNLIVFTGGTTRWHIKDISTKYNQIYKVVGNNSVDCLVSNAGTGSMVDPDTLESFIEYGVKNFPANRYELIMWDHGAGSVSGYGYDEKYPKLGSMSLAGIDKALTEAGVKFDFIGFDACLMATVETALMLGEHADYLIASEESEPGIGWYYTEWLNALGKNSSMPTIQIGKNIADSFVKTCTSETPRQPATLSVIDLAEVDAVMSDKLAAFANSTTNLINNGQYKSVVSARSGAREFGSSGQMDLVDLVDLAAQIGTKEAKDLVNAILSCVKYNNTSNSMTNAYGLSVYFPYRTTKYVNSVLKTYDQIDLCPEYSTCIKSFATYSGTGQVASGGSHSAQQSFNSYDNSQSTSQNSSDFIFDLINIFMSSGSGSSNQQPQQQTDPYSELISFGLGLLFDSMFNKSIADYVAINHFDADLNWKNGKIAISEKQWSMVTDLQLNVFIDDGKGYIDLGTDNIFDVDDKGNLLQMNDLTWLAVSTNKTNWQVVPFYYISSTIVDNEVQTTGRIPVLLNGEPADLLVYMDDETIEVVGATYNYFSEVSVVAKNLISLTENDEIEFVCDYYDYDGNFLDNYILGSKLVFENELYLGDVDISKYNYLASYQFTDIYGQNYWTVPMNK